MTAYQERRARGTFDLPVEFHHVSDAHPRYQMPFHWHMEYEIMRVVDGGFRLMLDEEEYTLSPGDAVIIPDGVVHGGVPDSCIYECIVFDLNQIIGDGSFVGKELCDILEHKVKIDRSVPKNSILNGLVGELFDAVSGEFSGRGAVAKGLVLQLMGNILRYKLYDAAGSHEKSERRRVHNFKKVIQKIRTNYAETITLDELAEVSGTTPKYFCRFFREMSGRTPVDYLNYYRIECAADRLLSTGDSITEIAFSCGFNDLSYFIKTFSRYKGASPRTYRKEKTGK